MTSADELKNYLQFYKSIIVDDSSGNNNGEKLNKYIKLIEKLDEGEFLAIRDPLERAVAMLFQVVIENNYDPWDIDLVAFCTQYLAHVKHTESVDLIVAGRLIYMAWYILKLKSRETVVFASKTSCDVMMKDDVATTTTATATATDWFFDEFDITDNNMNLSNMSLSPSSSLSPPLSSESTSPTTLYNFSEALKYASEPPLREMVRRRCCKRQVTLMELISAFESARIDLERERKLAVQRAKLRELQSKLGRVLVTNKIHRENLIEDIQITLQEIEAYNGSAIPLSKLKIDTKEEFITRFISILHLAYYKSPQIKLWQQNFPHGEIYLQKLST